MLRHIVMWKFRPGTEAERDLFLTGLQGLYGAIPELKSCQVLRGRSVQIHPDRPGGGGLSAAGSGGIRKKRRRSLSRPLNRRRNTS